MQGSTFGSSSINPGPPADTNDFLLMTGDIFQLMSGDNFLLMAP